MTYLSDHHRWRRRTLLFLLAGAVAIGLLSTTRQSEASHGSLILPFDAVSTLYICQGYNGPISHQGVFAVDLSVTQPRAGGKGCVADNASAGRNVHAPFGGLVVSTSPARGEICISSGDGFAIRLTHMNPVLVGKGATVSTEQIVGRIAPQNQVGNGGVAHLYVELWQANSCFVNGRTIPFDNAHGSALSGYNLYEKGGSNQWHGQALTRSAVSPPPPPAAPAPPAPPTPTPQTAVVEDSGVGFSLGGPSQYWLQYGIGSAGHMIATWNNGPCSYGPSTCPPNDVNYAVWRPTLTATTAYRVCAFIPPDHAYTKNARYQVGHAAGVTQVAVNQQPISGWTSLGVFNFNAGESGYVYLGDWTGEAFAKTQVGFDAMKWVPNAGNC